MTAEQKAEQNVLLHLAGAGINYSSLHNQIKSIKHGSHIITIRKIPLNTTYSQYIKSIVSAAVEVYHKDTHNYVSHLERQDYAKRPCYFEGETLIQKPGWYCYYGRWQTGHLVFQFGYTIGVAKYDWSSIDIFPPTNKQQIRIQLAMVLNAVVSQQLRLVLMRWFLYLKSRICNCLNRDTDLVMVKLIKFDNVITNKSTN